MRVKKLLWYLCLLGAPALLVYAFMVKDIGLSVAAFGMAYALKKTNRFIDIPTFYQNKGVTNDIFEGKGRR
jgi:lipid-A-disaccharide synthase-like uncharacterized protein